jgi:translation initiation factor 1 (eIF-1/SUI1)
MSYLASFIVLAGTNLTLFSPLLPKNKILKRLTGIKWKYIFVVHQIQKCMTFKGMNDLDQPLYTDYPEFEYEYANIQEPRTLPPDKQSLLIGLDKRKIDGLPITYITGFVGRRIDLIKVEEQLQDICHTCGSSKKHDIVLKGDVRKRAYIFLRNSGYKVKFAEN